MAIPVLLVSGHLYSGGTMAAGQLGRVEHIVVLMIENRSFDNLLGGRTVPPTQTAANPKKLKSVLS
jgi:phospholipase C